MSQQTDRRTEHGPGLVLEEARPEVARPPLYQVILLNDDFTPMDFVVVVLETFFNLDRERATQVMLHVHTRGKGVCGVFTREVAETKVTQVNEFSRTHQHPLLCTMEKASPAPILQGKEIWRRNGCSAKTSSSPSASATRRPASSVMSS